MIATTALESGLPLWIGTFAVPVQLVFRSAKHECLLVALVRQRTSAHPEEVRSCSSGTNAVSGSEAGNVPALQAGDFRIPTRTQGIALGLRAVSPLD
jgi:hypothetical protein